MNIRIKRHMPNIKLNIFLSILVIIFAVNITCLIYPISGINRGKKNLYFEELGTMDFISDNYYVTRIEFLEALLRSIGITDSIIKNYTETSRAGLIVDEVSDIDKYFYIFGDEFESVKEKIYKHEDVRDINDKVSTYEALCNIAADNGCLQTYMTVNEDSFSEFEFRGSNYITVHEAVTMVQACLSSVKSNGGRFNYNTSVYNTLYLKSHFSGILLPCDSAYWSVIDTKLTRNDMVVLLYRLLQKG